MANEFPLPDPLISPDKIVGSPNDILPPPEENPVVPPAYQAPQPVVAPPIKTSPFKFLVPVVGGLLVLGIIIFIATKIFSGVKPESKSAVSKAKDITINYWGLWDTAATMKPVIDAFEAENPGIKVNYQLQSHQDYQDRLQTAIAGSSSPDIARIHSTWLPIFIKNLLPSPANTISTTEIQTNFYPVVGNSVIVSNQVFGVPMVIDGLVMFVNTNMLKQASLQAPKNWNDLSSAAKALTIRDSVTGKITRAGVALGNTSNVRLWPDIVSMMLFQSGANLLNPTGKEVSTTLSFYTSFAGLGQYWDDTLPDSVVAFANEKVGIILAPLWIVPEIQAINPRLSWQTAPVPQLPDSEPVNWASMWIETVPKNAPHTQEAWKFLSFLASAKAQQILFESAAKERNLPQVPANKAVSQLASQNPVVAPLVSQLATAKTFYTSSLTHDNETALNSRLIKYLEDAINSIAKKQDATKTLETLNLGFNQVLSQYRLVNPLPTPTGR